jgi:hypothetical protein
MIGNDMETTSGNGPDVEVEKVLDIKARYEGELLRKANVVGVGIGFRQVGGQFTSEPALVVNVTHKVPYSQLAPDDLIPTQIEGVPVEVQTVGQIRAF